MASQVAPAYLMVIMLLLPLAAFLISRSAQVFMWWVSTCTRRAFGGSIYGLTFASGTLVNKKQWSEINKSMATLPNLAEGLSGSDWATDDIQQRYALWLDLAIITKLRVHVCFSLHGGYLLEPARPCASLDCNHMLIASDCYGK